ncbi:MAG: leucine-rich repeat protein [Thermoguttaceae bacterium]
MPRLIPWLSFLILLIPSVLLSNPTNRDSFQWDGTWITRFIGQETEVVVPDGATEIRPGAFADCRSVTSVTLPEGVTKIGIAAFNRCSSLKTVTLPESLKEIERGAFINCPALKEWPLSADHPFFKKDGIALLTKDGKTLIACPGAAGEYRIPEGVTGIEGEAFRGCASLTSVLIPEGVTRIGLFTFFGCTSLKSVVIPKGVTEIENCTFADCTSLTSVVIPEGVTEIGEGVFIGCTSLTSIVLPKGVTVIPEETFEGCTSLTSVVIPEGVKKIEWFAFSGCTSLRSVNLPDSVRKIKGAAFVNGPEISPTHPYFKKEGACLLTKDGKKLVACWTNAEEFRIPDGVKVIGEGAFAERNSLKSVVIPEGVTKIEYGAFYGCRALTSVAIPGSVKKIADEVFNECPDVTISASKGSRAEEHAGDWMIPFKDDGSSVPRAEGKSERAKNDEIPCELSIIRIDPESEWGLEIPTSDEMLKLLKIEDEYVFPSTVEGASLSAWTDREGHVCKLYLNGIQLDQPLLDQILRFSRLRDLDFFNCKFSPGLQYHFDGLKNLEKFGVINCIEAEKGIPKELLKSLSECSRLQSFVFSNQSDLSIGQLTREDFLLVGQMKSLRSLKLPHLSDEGLEILAGLPKIQKLSANRTQITEKSIPFLHRFPKLRELYLHGSRDDMVAINDAFLQAISDIPLRILAIPNAKLTDKSVETILGWKSLIWILYLDRDMSPEGRQKIGGKVPML